MAVLPKRFFEATKSFSSGNLHYFFKNSQIKNEMFLGRVSFCSSETRSVSVNKKVLSSLSKPELLW